MGCYRILILLVFLIDGVIGDTSGLNLISVIEGDSVPLNTDVIKQQKEPMRWYFNDTLIALINGEASSCLYDGEDGRFRDRLDVDYETGSLTIRDIRPEHAGRYEANFIQNRSSGTSQSLNRNSKCDSTKIIRKTSNISDTIKTLIVSVRTPLSVPDKIIDELHEMGKEQKSDRSSVLFAGVVSGVVVGVLLLAVAVTAGVIMYLRRRSFRNAEVEKNKLEHLLKV